MLFLKNEKRVQKRLIMSLSSQRASCFFQHQQQSLILLYYPIQLFLKHRAHQTDLVTNSKTFFILP